MTKIQSINSNQLYIAQNAEVSLKLAGNTAQVTFTAGRNRKCPIRNLSKNEFMDLFLASQSPLSPKPIWSGFLEPVSTCVVRDGCLSEHV